MDKSCALLSIKTSWMLPLLCSSGILLFPLRSSSQSAPPPLSYTVPYTSRPPVIDGRRHQREWKAAAWSADFVDIEGNVHLQPEFRTRMKMLWDEAYLYILAEMEEPDLWATLRQYDDIVFQDHDFEVFIDPDGDTRNYIEIEVNALGTIMDLFLDKPYRDGGKPQMDWNTRGLRTGIGLKGSLNDSRDTDRGWVVEWAIPMETITKATGVAQPKEGTQWRINFSRVEWLTDKTDTTYAKRLNPATGKPFPERNWVWSPQGKINMHLPEQWGYLKFVR